MALAKDAAFLVKGTVWVLAWERWQQIDVPPLGMFWWVEQTEKRKVIALTRCSKR